jgi:hypothetical protein
VRGVAVEHAHRFDSVAEIFDAGDFTALQAAEKLAAPGARVEIVTRDRNLAPEVMAMPLTPSIRVL